MSEPKFVDELPPSQGGGRLAAQATLRALREQPGRWAEIATYPKARYSSAHNRGRGLASRHADIEYAVRTVGDDVVLYYRAVSA